MDLWRSLRCFQTNRTPETGHSLRGGRASEQTASATRAERKQR